MRVAIGADHGGFALKEHIKSHLQKNGHEVFDAGNRKLDPRDDFTDFSHRVASALHHDLCERGVIICTTGAGTCVVANRYPDIRAVECACLDDVKQAREHLDMNVMTLGSIKVPPGVAEEMADAFISTRALKGRYLRRRNKIELQNHGHPVEHRKV
jgi:ribose 5-phosphate isomerase B